mgnify:CR=1 FL=1
MNQTLIRSKIVLEGMTQRTLAEKIGMTPNSLSRKLQRKRAFTLPEVCAICDVLHIIDPVPYFFDGNKSVLTKGGDQA